MKTEHYFQSFKDYFWQWEEDFEVLAIPKGPTIAYREFMIQTLEKLAPQGIPPFGPFLMSVIATNPSAKEAIDILENILKNTKDLNFASHWTDLCSKAMQFLRLLSDLPATYKEGTLRVQLFQVLFYNCHHLLSEKKARIVLEQYNNKSYDTFQMVLQNAVNFSIVHHDLTTISKIADRYKTTNDILNELASIPDIQEPIVLPEVPTETAPETFHIDLLLENEKTFHIGALIPRIWSGLHIPFHHNMPSQQPLGGVSDITNKGDLHRLLISEFAYDDNTFLSRLANNEALYLNREIPPTKDNMERVILIDISLKSWGTPKTIAYALLLAIVNHPKTDITCKAYVVGDNYYPIEFNSIDALIDSLQHLEGTLHPEHGLEAYFRDHSRSKPSEVFFISNAETMRNPVVQNLLQANSNRLKYAMYADHSGSVSVYRNLAKSKTHIQDLNLPLEELWTRKPGKQRRKFSDDLYYPHLRLTQPYPTKHLREAELGSIFAITKNKNLMQWSANTQKQGHHFWELILRDVPFFPNQWLIGNDKYGNEEVLLTYAQTRRALIFQLSSGKMVTYNLPDWDAYSFIYHQHHFYYIHSNYYLKFDVNLAEPIHYNEPPPPELVNMQSTRAIGTPNLKQSRKMILKHVNSVQITQDNFLQINNHRMVLRNYGMNSPYIQLEYLPLTNEALHIAKRTATNEFTFENGNTVIIEPEGGIICKFHVDYTTYVVSAQIHNNTEKLGSFVTADDAEKCLQQLEKKGYQAEITEADYLYFQTSLLLHSPLGLCSGDKFSGMDYFRPEHPKFFFFTVSGNYFWENFIQPFCTF